MIGKVLITGGAGFIGSHVADELLAGGYAVRVLDSLVPQVHGPERNRPEYLDADVELVVGDVRDPESVSDALKGIDAVVHFAAMVGVGQSMYAIQEYTDVNNRGTAVLLEELTERPVERLLVASSMSIYGEGLYSNSHGDLVDGIERAVGSLRAGHWELTSFDGEQLTPLPTPETKTPALSSIYALSKYDQERMCLLTGRAYNIPTIALRFFNAYGPRQALSNPYTGVLAIFASRFLNGNPPLIFEDGLQQRDFVSVRDIARACRLSLESEAAVGEVFNIGSGRSCTVLEVAEKLGETLGTPDIIPDLTGKYRVGDIRHCYADIRRAREVLGYSPQINLEDGLDELAASLAGQVASDKVAEAHAELAARRLAV